MHIDQKNLDALNAILEVTLEGGDYKEEVARVLKHYKKTARIPGFRKGHVPMGLLRRQHGKAVTAEAIEKKLQKALGDYIAEKKLDLLGQPLPVPKADLDWEEDTQCFTFEIGLAPAVSVDLKAPNALVAYRVEVDDASIQAYIGRLRKAHGTRTPREAVCEGVTLTGLFEEWDVEADQAVKGGLSHKASFELSQLGEAGLAALRAAKPGEVRVFGSKGFFQDPKDWTEVCSLPEEQACALELSLRFTVSQIETVEPAPLDQALFDAAYGQGEIESEAAFIERVKADHERIFSRQAEQRWFADARRFLIENTAFELPRDFLAKWIRFSQASITSQEQAESAYEESEKNLRWQLIEAQIARDYSLELKPDEVKAKAVEVARAQLWRYQLPDSSEKTVESLADHLLQNPEEQKRLSQQVFEEKLLQCLKKEMPCETKNCASDEFLKQTHP